MEYTEHELEVFEYLEELKESGETNMFGAAPYLQEEFGFDKREAKQFLQTWMRSLDENLPLAYLKGCVLCMNTNGTMTQKQAIVLTAIYLKNYIKP